MKESNIAQSIKACLLNMSEGDNKRYQQLVVRFFHERLLYRLSKSPYREHFILKGGTLLYAYEKFPPRPTLDMDFMGQRIDGNHANILKTFKEIASMVYSEDGILFLSETMTAENITVEKEYPGLRIGMIGTLGTYKQKLTLDIGFGDVIVPHPIELSYPTLFESMDEPDIMAYSLETVVAEKFQTMIDRGVFNSRMKDYFDLYKIFSTHYSFDENELGKAILATFGNRTTSYEEDHEFFMDHFGQDANLNRQWNNYVQKLNIDLPSFGEIHKSIAEKLRSYWLRLKQ